MRQIALVDYGSGNLRSAQKALMAAAARSSLALEVRTTSDPALIAMADAVVLPGVGAFAACARAVQGRSGIWEALQTAVMDRAVPFLGICVGMQLMATRGLEFGVTPGFNWIEGDVAVLQTSGPDFKIPHMGWNALIQTQEHPILKGLPDGVEMYFTHSYAMAPSHRRDCITTTDHGGPFASAVARDNYFGVQFHPEKSQVAGLVLLTNFLEWHP